MQGDIDNPSAGINQGLRKYKLLTKLTWPPSARGKVLVINHVALVGVLYVLIVTLVSHLLPLSDALRALLAQPVLIILPYLVGKPTVSLIRKIASAHPAGHLSDFLLAWMTGISLIMMVEIVLYTNYSFSVLTLTALLMGLGLLAVFIAPKSGTGNVSAFGLPAAPKFLVLSVLYGFVFSAVLTFFWPYPFANDNDYIRHAYYTVSVLRGRPLLFYAPYLPTMHTLYALASFLTGVSPSGVLYVLWSSRFLFFPIYSGGVFLFANSLAHHPRFSMCVSVAATSLVYSSQNSLTPGQTAPTNVIVVLFPLMIWIAVGLHEKGGLARLGNLGLLKVGVVISFLSGILYLTRSDGLVGYDLGIFLFVVYVIVVLVSKTVAEKGRDLFLSISLILIALLLIDKAQGFEADAVVIAFMFLLALSDRLSLVKTRILALATMVTTWVVADSFYFELMPYPKPLVTFPGGALYMYGWNSIWGLLNEGYPGVILILFVLGLGLAIALEREKTLISSGSLVSILLLAYFSPTAFSYRFLAFAGIIILFFSAYFLVSPLRYKVFNKSLRSKCLALVLSVLLFTVLFFPPIVSNDCQNLQNPTLIEKQERLMVFEIGTYLRQHAQKDALVIGDTEASGWYQGIATFYGLVNSVYLWENGTYREDLVKSIYTAQSSQEAYNLIMKIAHTPKYVVDFPDNRGDETKRWFTEPSQVILLYDDELANTIGGGQQSVAKFFDPRYFTLLYTIANSLGEDFYVFEVNPSPVENSNNLLNMPSFEKGSSQTSRSPFEWVPALANQPPDSLDDVTWVDGHWSYRVEGVSIKGWGLVLSSPIEVTGGEFYALKANIKTSNANRTEVRLEYLDDGTRTWRDVVILTADQPSSDWREYDALVKLPTHVSEIRVALVAGSRYDHSNGASISWFDDLALFEVYGLDRILFTTQPVSEYTAPQQTLLQVCQNYSNIAGFTLLAGFLYLWVSVHSRELLTTRKEHYSDHESGSGSSLAGVDSSDL